MSAIPHLLPVLEDTDETFRFIFSPNLGVPRLGEKEWTFARSDAALVALLGITGLRCEDYGLVSTAGAVGEFPRALRYGFPSEEARSAGIKKFKEWWGRNKEKPKYRNLKPLDIGQPKARD